MFSIKETSVISNLEITLFDMTVALSTLTDLVSPLLVGHHKRVTCIAASIANQMKLPPERIKHVVLASLLHDTGALSLEERVEALNFEIESASRHCELGYSFLSTFGPFSKAADIVLYHHTPWNERTAKMSLESHILHLADRIEVLIDKSHNVVIQANDIKSRIIQGKGSIFCPEAVEAFESLSVKEAFWLDILYKPQSFLRYTSPGSIRLQKKQLEEISLLFRRMIDFRSRFTSTHSTCVAAVAESLAEMAGMSREECLMMRIAGNLHDLGKLAIPQEILEKPGKLSKEEAYTMKSHTYFSYQVLQNIKGFETINHWASFHHELLNGKGYPFKLGESQLSLGSRIMCVADIFTAVSEDRPYRMGMNKQQVCNILRSQVHNGHIDTKVTGLLFDNFEYLDQVRRQAETTALQDYNAFLA